jgi:hypothetical protein
VITSFTASNVLAATRKRALLWQILNAEIYVNFMIKQYVEHHETSDELISSGCYVLPACF